MDKLASNAMDETIIVIRKSSAWRFVDFKEIWQHRDLVTLCISREFISRYRQTILGPLWFVVQAFLMGGLFTLVFSKLANVSTEQVPSLLFYMSGITLWNYFAQTLETIAGTLVRNAQLHSKIYLPPLVMPLSTIGSKLILFFLQFGVLIILYGYCKFSGSGNQNFAPTYVLLALPLILLHSAALALGVGLWFAALSIRYRDLLSLLTFFLQLAMYATPIVFPVATIPEHLRFVVYLNPLAILIEMMHIGLFGKGTFDPALYALSLAVTAAVLISGLIFFNSKARTFVDLI